jgi:hypothetical protein
VVAVVVVRDGDRARLAGVLTDDEGYVEWDASVSIGLDITGRVAVQGSTT